MKWTGELRADELAKLNCSLKYVSAASPVEQDADVTQVMGLIS